jgi:hypothetical protein
VIVDVRPVNSKVKLLNVASDEMNGKRMSVAAGDIDDEFTSVTGAKLRDLVKKVINW